MVFKVIPIQILVVMWLQVWSSFFIVVSLISEMQFGVMQTEARIRTCPHTSLWRFKLFHSLFCIDTILIFLLLANVQCHISRHFGWLVEGICILHGVLWEWGTILPFSVRSVTEASVKFLWDNLQLHIETFQDWKIQQVKNRFCPFQSCACL